jgi:uncharacterized protein
MVFWFFISIIALYSSALISCYLFQRRYIYRRRSKGSQPQISLRSPAGEFVRIVTEDGENLVAWHSPPLDDRPLVIFFHGSADGPGQRAVRFLALASAGFGVLAPYFRGYGESTGAPTERGLLLDAAAVYRYCNDLYPPERIALWGFSLGSAVAVLLASEKKVAALVLEAPFTSLVDLTKKWFPFLPMNFILRDRFCADAKVISVNAPILVLHGEADREIPISFGKQLFDDALEPKEFHRFPTGGHRDLDNHGALAVVRRFLSRLPAHSSEFGSN